MSAKGEQTLIGEARERKGTAGQGKSIPEGTASAKALGMDAPWGVQRRPGWLVWRVHGAKVVGG